VAAAVEPPPLPVPGAAALVLELELEQAVASTAATPRVTPRESGLRILTRLFSFEMSVC
jgi:hypothetical protein